MADSSFDVISEVDKQELKNAVNAALSEIKNRFDFKKSKSNIEINSDGDTLTLISDDEYKMTQVIDVLVNKLIKRKISKKAFDFEKKIEAAAGQTVRQVVPIQNGLSTEQTKKITKLVKDSKLKVQTRIQDSQVRITGKKRDDLQAIMQKIKDANFDFDAQFTNYRQKRFYRIYITKNLEYSCIYILDNTKIAVVIKLLINGKNLPDKYKDHKLLGNYKNRRECHIEPDCLLIYKLEINKIIFERTGSHSDLF